MSRIDFPIRFSSSRKTFVLLVLSAAALAFLWHFAGPPGLTPRDYGRYSDEQANFKVTKQVLWGPVDFDSRSATPELSSVKEFKVTDSSKFRSVDISFQMKTYAMTQYNNIFQTADFNDGLRLELSLPATLTFITGYIHTKAAGNVIPYEFLTHLAFNQWYAVHIHIDSENWMTVTITPGDDAAQETKTISGMAGKFDVSAIAVGTGYGRTRPFDGAIKDFTIDYRLLSRTSLVRPAIRLLYLPLTVSLVVLMLIFLGSWLYQVGDGFKRIAQYVRLPELNRRDKIHYLTFIMIAGFVASTFFHYARGMFWNEGFPLNTYLPIPGDIGGDMRRGYEHWMHSHFNGVGYGASYFPSAYLLYDLLGKLGSLQLAWIVTWSAFSVFMTVYAYRNIAMEDRIESIQNTVVCAFTSYPFLFNFHTANLEIYVFMMLVLFITFYRQDRPLLSSLCLAMPISMKLFPAVFLILLISDKKYKTFLYTVLWVGLLTLLPLLIYDGGLRSGFAAYFARLKESQGMYTELMIIGAPGIHYGHSLLGAIRILAGPSFPAMQDVMMPYLILTGEVLGALAVYVLFYEKEFWKKVALLVFAMNLLPYTSTDYKLMHIFIPLFLFVNHEKVDPLDILYILFFSLLLIPKDYAYFQNNPLFNLNNVLNPLCMLLIATMIIVSRYTARDKSQVYY